MIKLNTETTYNFECDQGNFSMVISRPGVSVIAACEEVLDRREGRKSAIMANLAQSPGFLQAAETGDTEKMGTVPAEVFSLAKADRLGTGEMLALATAIAPIVKTVIGFEGITTASELLAVDEALACQALVHIAEAEVTSFRAGQVKKTQ